MAAEEKKVVLYEKQGRVARITLNRPSRLNAISLETPSAIRKAVKEADLDDDIHVIILQGSGTAFCSGYDLKEFAEKNMERKPNGEEAAKTTKRGDDPTIDYRMMSANTEDFMSLWRCTKPTIAKVHGFAVAGGSDIALCCDLVVMADEAFIGYPPARIWGIPTTMQWIHRLGPEKAKKMLFTGDLISGKQAKEMGLVLDSVPEKELDMFVDNLAKRICGVPRNQLHMSKMVVNSVIDPGLRHAQMLATFFDGFARNSPEGKWFKQMSEKHGFQKIVKQRDSGEPIAEGVSESSYFFEDFSKL